MIRKHYLLFAAFLILSLLVMGVSRQALDSRRHTIIISSPPPEPRMPVAAAKALSGQFSSLLSKYILLDVASFLGGQQSVAPEQWSKVVKSFTYCVALDPYFMQNYFLAQGNLPWQGFVTETNDLLETARQVREWDFRPGYYKGFNDYYFLNDYSSASREFMRAGKIPGASVLLTVLGARFAAKTGRAHAAIALLQEQLKVTEQEDRREEIIDRIEALQGVLLLEKAVARYHKENHSYPFSLDALVETGLLPRLPENPYGESYYYNSQNGSVTFDDVGFK